MPAAVQADDSVNDPSVARAIALINQALLVVDAIGNRLDLGARLQEIIDDLEEDRDAAS